MFKKFIAAAGVGLVLTVGAAGSASAVPIDPSPSHPARHWAPPSSQAVKVRQHPSSGSSIHKFAWFYGHGWKRHFMPGKPR